jgi:hypothetical protein
MLISEIDIALMSNGITADSRTPWRPGDLMQSSGSNDARPLSGNEAFSLIKSFVVLEY